MSKIEQNKQKKRVAILDAAQQVFLSEGYGLASMDKIAHQAAVTKQTVYRYFPSKIELFQATLEHMGRDYNQSYASQLEREDTREALLGFAVAFMHHHLSDTHIATLRLLVAESPHSPEIVQRFMAAGRDGLRATLLQFFSERLDTEQPEQLFGLWTGMLLAPRSGVLVGVEKPSDAMIEEHAKSATDLLLAGVSLRNQ
ncbi:TetR/AcrR family transcriptional regulator [Aliagarivorans marinus]|uniref:TetR/AcrR family transcriptional regulator n=1 Tax=Aliagarivorans marinus TaxID=561965 RepID=UPI00040B27D0|nr:TetR/AcrR family transcriptional regulator [Aliagarivorans marinus]